MTSDAMTWPEPLTASSRTQLAGFVALTVRDGEGRRVAEGHLLVDRARCARAGVFRVTVRDGAPRQRQRALVLLVREAFRYAADHGMQRFHTLVTPNVQALAERLLGLKVDDQGCITAELHPVRSHVLEVSRADGDLV